MSKSDYFGKLFEVVNNSDIEKRRLEKEEKRIQVKNEEEKQRTLFERFREVRHRIDLKNEFDIHYTLKGIRLGKSDYYLIFEEQDIPREMEQIVNEECLKYTLNFIFPSSRFSIENNLITLKGITQKLKLIRFSYYEEENVWIK